MIISLQHSAGTGEIPLLAHSSDLGPVLQELVKSIPTYRGCWCYDQRNLCNKIKYQTIIQSILSVRPCQTRVSSIIRHSCRPSFAALENCKYKRGETKDQSAFELPRSLAIVYRRHACSQWLLSGNGPSVGRRVDIKIHKCGTPGQFPTVTKQS